MSSGSVKAGALDDPVWDQPIQSSLPPKTPRPGPRWPLLVIGVVMLVLVAVALTRWAARQEPGAGGDPGGRILKALQPTTKAMPVGVTNISTQNRDSLWTPKCPDNSGGQAGWSAVGVVTQFTTSTPKQQVVDAVNSVLVQQGWSRHDEAFGPDQGLNAHWTKRLSTGTYAEASVYPVPSGSKTWYLSATAEPPGYALPGC